MVLEQLDIPMGEQNEPRSLPHTIHLYLGHFTDFTKHKTQN